MQGNTKDLVVGQLTNVAETIESRTADIAGLEVVGSRAVDVLTNFSEYLEDRSNSEIVMDAVAVVKKYPLPLLLGVAGACIGMLIAARLNASFPLANGSDSDPAMLH